MPSVNPEIWVYYLIFPLGKEVLVRQNTGNTCFQQANESKGSTGSSVRFHGSSIRQDDSVVPTRKTSAINV